ncbi:dipeptidase, putative [Longilinea arvoryzae]|uniref:Dipeptidase, putative n=1 Tax=Longilinea arvoryzae TaxID=360412 RepID=A0A0S7BD88_9CHLR|nr:Sapep family Mn(2+)-dependent dipeptidase [Longilinea arvoryzae]GAP15710.1 dipeptidase, putative [Longilinea arvoryzae]
MLQERVNQYFENKESTFVDAISRLIAVKSVQEKPLPGMPFGKGPADALALALNMANELGFSTANFDNYVGTVNLSDRETRLGMLCHLDVVGEGIGWSTPPYEAVLKDGMLYGRGSSDNKGPAVAALFALKAVKDLGIPLQYNARLILGTDEETASSDIVYYFERQPAPRFVFSPDGAFPVTNTEKGGLKTTFTKNWSVSEALPRVTAVKGGAIINVIPQQAEAWVEGMSVAELQPICEGVAKTTGAEFNITRENGSVRILAVGKGGHAAMPEKSNNALTALLTLLSALPLAESESAQAIRELNRLFPHGDYYGKAIGIAQSDEISGPLTLSFDIYEQTLTGFSGRFDSRTPLCATRENSLDVVAQRFAGLGIALESKVTAPHHTSCDSPFIQTLLKTYEQYTGRKGFCESTGGGTYVHHIDGGVAFGAMMPGFESKMHGADEHASIADLVTASKVFTQVIADVCG